MHDPTLQLLAQHVTAMLESWYKPILMFLPVIPYAWLISSKLEKDSRYFHFNTPMWNSIFLGSWALAMILVLLIPIFWIGWPLQLMFLAGPVLAYWKYRNDQVPESQKFYLSGDSFKSKMDARKAAKAARDAVIQFYDPNEDPVAIPPKEEPAFLVHVAVEDILGPAIEGRASAVEINVTKAGTTISQSVDGIRYKREPVAADLGLKMVDYLKGIAGMEVSDRRKRQTADCRMRAPQGTTMLSLTTAGRSDGVMLRIEFDRATRLNRPFDQLGLLPSQLTALREYESEAQAHGIILLGSPSGQGLTTTCYSVLGRHDAYTSNIKSLEREVFVQLDGVDHVTFDPTNAEADYATQLQSILRRDPDIVLTSHVRDEETAGVITAPGMEGPLLYVPQRAATITDQIRDWVKVVGDVKQAAKSLRLVMNQRLIRTLCANCRQPFQPTAEQLKKLNLPADKVQQLYRAGGKVQIKNKIEPCPVCGGSGYLGQTAIFEVMVVDSEARKLLAGGDLKGALAHARRNKMIYLQEAALSKVASGETSIEEVVRVTAPPKDGSGAKKPAVPVG